MDRLHDPLWRNDATVIAVVALAHATSHFMQMLLVPLFPLFLHEFNLSYSQIGLLVSVLYTVSSIGQVSSGFIVDRLGARPVLFLSMSLFILAAISAATATGYGSLLFTMVLVGLANATFHPVDFTILNQRVSAQRLGYGFSLHGITGNLGWAFSPVFLVGLSTLFSWRGAYVGTVVLLLVVFAILYWNKDLLATQTAMKSAPTQSIAGTSSSGSTSAIAVFRLPAIWWCFSFFMFATMTLAVVQSYSVLILQKLHDVSLYVANTTLTAYMLCGAVGMLVGGWYVSKVPAEHSNRVVARAMSIAGLILILAATGILGAVGSCILFALTGFAIGLAGPSRDMMIKHATPVGATGRVYGLVYSGMDVGFAIAPVVFGVFMDRGYYASVIAGAGVTLFIAVGLALAVGRTKPIQLGASQKEAMKP